MKLKNEIETKIRGFLKDKYVQIELSEFELQMIWAIVDNTKHEEKDFFTEINLNDLKQQLTLEINKGGN